MYPRTERRQESQLRLCKLLSLLVVVLGAPAAAFAQSGTVGTILGTIVDQTGQPIKGVKITATSPTQIGGAKVTYTNDEGGFALRALQPGTFDIKATAPKLRPVVQNNVRVTPSAAADVTMMMEVDTDDMVDEVKVVEKAPLVSVRTANVGESFDEEFLDNMPTESKFALENAVSTQTPGMVNKGVRNFRSRGGTTNQNAMQLEGFTVQGIELTTGSMAAIEVQTAGYGAEFGDAPGGVFNLVSKSGSNKFEIDLRAFHEDSTLRFFLDETDVVARNFNTMLTPSFSGPIIKDRLWFFATADLRAQVDGRDHDPSDILPVPESRVGLSARPQLKLTWQMTPRNKLQSFTHFTYQQARNTANAAMYENDAQKLLEKRDVFTGLTWEALLSDSVFFKSQVALQNQHQINGPRMCSTDPADCLYRRQVRQTYPRQLRLGNFENIVQDRQQSAEFVNTLELFTNSKTFGDHSARLRSQVMASRFEDATAWTGDGYDQYDGATPSLRTTYYSSDPRITEGRQGWGVRGTSTLVTNTSLSDAIRVGRYLTVTPGIGFHTAVASNAGQAAQLENRVFTPHISVAWDATHDGRTVLRASFNQYVDLDVNRLARFALGDMVNNQCRWNEVTGAFDLGCVYRGGAAARTFGLPCSPTGLDATGAPCKETLKVPKTWEYTVGAEREVVPGVAIGGDVVYRLFANPYQQRETNRIWNSNGTDVISPGEGSYRNGRAEAIMDMGTPDAAKRRYLGVTGTIRKREGHLKLIASYTWSVLEGNVDDGENSEYGTNPVRDQAYLNGYLPDDSRHTIKTSGTYAVTQWLSCSLSYQYTSGSPYSRRYRNDALANFTDLRARVGESPGLNVNDPSDDRPLRLPDQQTLNLQLRGNMKPLMGQNLDLFLDVLNVLALRTTMSVEEQDGPEFGRQLTRKAPMRLRIGLRYRY